MMRLWFESYAKPTSHTAGAALSAATHAVLITAWVIATLPAPDVPKDSIANRVFYIPPPDRVRGEEGTRESVTYIALAPGPGVGNGARKIGDEPPLVREQSIGAAPRDTAESRPTPPVAGPPDSVFSILEVDTPVARSANSAGPAYPLNLLNARVMGFVAAQYVVDTTGFADTASFHVLSSTNPEFVNAVRDALPYMRFTPAKIGTLKVRQLVEQQFTFRISTSDTAKVVPKVAPKKP